MTDPIKPGDLVIVIRWPCCGAFLGYPMVVDEIRSATHATGICSECQRAITRMDYVVGDQYRFPLPWVKKCEPGGEHEETRQPEELAA